MDMAGLMQIKKRFEVFNREHPKMVPFIRKVREDAFKEGAIVEIKVTSPEGKEYVSNLRVTANDVETIRILAGNKGGF
ncbi:hypothetical protein SAMN02910289_01513 [Lachnospiraceae bacterium RM5]|nr:hypothetical protein SAMN02910289_01513 [Lachnospiraceae bacterium RM5]